MTTYKSSKRHGLYRSRDGVILGVCRGIAEYFDFSVFWVRVIALAILVFTCFWPAVGFYFLAALIMKPRPVLPINSDDEQEFYNSYTSSKKSAVHRIRRRYHNLERRLQRLEHSVTSPEYDWDRRFNQ